MQVANQYTLKGDGMQDFFPSGAVVPHQLQAAYMLCMSNEYGVPEGVSSVTAALNDYVAARLTLNPGTDRKALLTHTAFTVAERRLLAS